MSTLTIDEVQRRKRADTAMRSAQEAVDKAEAAVLHGSPDAVDLADRALVLVRRAESLRQACMLADTAKAAE